MTVALTGALVLLSSVAAVGYRLITPQERFESLGCHDRPSLERQRLGGHQQRARSYRGLS
jgi:hypothetical protein